MSLSKVQKYYTTGRLEQAFTELEHLAKSGDTDAMLELSRWYKSGRYVKQNPQKAMHWCSQALVAGSQAAQEELLFITQVEDICRLVQEGDPSGNYLLAQTYEEGILLEKDLSKAVLYYKKAMEQDNILALSKLQELKEAGAESAQMLYLDLGQDPKSKMYDPAAIPGLCYDILCGHPQNGRALDILKRNAAVGDSEAVFYLGKYYLQESTDTRTQKQGLLLLERSAGDGSVEAMLLLAETYAHNSIRQNPPLAAEYYKKLHEHSNLTGTYLLAGCYRTGFGLEQDVEQADQLLGIAAARGYEPAVTELEAAAADREVKGHRYFCGQGVPRDYSRAVTLYSRAYEQGYLTTEGIRNLAFCILNGLGTEKNVSFAMQLYQQAADAGDCQSQYFVGNCFRYGFNGYVKADDIGISYYKMSAEAGNVDAMCALAFCLVNGIGTAPNEPLGWSYYKKAASLGSVQARDMLELREK